MASFVYAVWSITNVASVHCSVRPEISPCTCEPVYSNNYVELSCEKVDSFHQIVDALSNKFEPFVNISLKISHSQLDDLEMRSFTDMNLSVVKLRMQWNGLKSVPELPFRGLSNVEFLSVGDNELEEIPKHMLNHMPIVKTLDMGRCRIRSVLQDDLKGTQMVMNLFLPSNNITRLDKGSFPPSMVTLHLGRNQIESLNGTLRDLNKLESLFINMNSISTLEDELPESNRLKLIIAQNNRLERLPESMRYMNKLETLHLQFNRLKSLDGIFRNAINLNQFFAFNNEIEYLAEDEFQASEVLEELDLACNHIKSLNSSLLPLVRLCSANFSFNDIEEFSMNEIRGLKHLKQLDVSNNRIQKLTGRQENKVDLHSFLIEFKLDYNQLKSLDGALMGLNSLRILTLSYNQIERILPDDFIGLVKLEILDLSHNQLLTLKEMQLTSLPSLKILKAAYNNLTKLDKDFHGLPVLCQANLTNNQISSISTELVSETRCMNHNVPGKLELHLDDNPIMCDERLNELCPIMLAQETRIRGRSQCFENDQEVCTVLPMLFTPILLSENYPIILQQQINTQMVPANTKPIVQVIVPSPILLNKQLKKTDELLPPIIAPLGQPIIKPLLVPTGQQQHVPATIITETETLAQSIVNDVKEAVESAQPETQTINITDNLQISNLTTIIMPITRNSANLTPTPNDIPITSIPTTPTTTITTPTTPLPIINSDVGNPTSTTIVATTETTTTTTTTTSTIATPSLQQSDIPLNSDNHTLVLNIEEVPIIESTAASVSDTIALQSTILTSHSSALELTPTVGVDGIEISAAAAAAAAAAASSSSSSTTQPEYATVEYLPPLDEYPPSVLDEDSKTNSVHEEEFASVVLANLDTAPQSLIIPEEPPENP